MDENRQMDGNRQNQNTNSFFSEPDENGVRYYRSTLQSAHAVQGMQAAGASVKSTKNKSFRNSLIVFGCILVGLTILGVSCNNMFSDSSGQIQTPSSPYIGVVYVEGTIQQSNRDTWGSAVGYQHAWTLDAIDTLMMDMNNRGLVIFVNSPGGGIYESDELYLKVKEYQEITGNPVYSAFGSMAASGGYYISASADKIVANRNCWTGSIGVTIGTLVDLSGFLERYDIKTATITSGENKAMGGNFDPLTQEQRVILQALVDEAYDQFVEVVAEGRGMEIEQVKAISDGRIYSARQAMELGLVDEIGTLQDAVYDMQATYRLYGCEITDIYYIDNSFLGHLLGNINIKGFSSGSEAAVLMNILEERSQFPVSYVCELLQ